MSYSTWGTAGRGICTSDLLDSMNFSSSVKSRNSDASRLMRLIRKAPNYCKVVKTTLKANHITDPTLQDLLKVEQGYNGLATIIANVISEAEGIHIEDCDDLNGRTYALYVQQYPWQMTEKEKNFTPADIDKIFDTYLDILTDHPGLVSDRYVTNCG